MKLKDQLMLYSIILITGTCYDELYNRDMLAD